jgi:peptide/nickel transport system permease protein
MWIDKFKKNKIGLSAVCLVIFFALLGLYAPFLASSKPLVVLWQGKLYFPLFRYLFFSGFYTKPIDLFYNILMFTLPFACIGSFLLHRYSNKKKVLWFIGCCILIQSLLFVLTLSTAIKDPTSDYSLYQKRETALSFRTFQQEDPLTAPFIMPPSWHFELAHMNDYKKLDIITKELLYEKQHNRIVKYMTPYEAKKNSSFPTKWNITRERDQEQIESLQTQLSNKKSEYEEAKKVYSELIVRYQPISHAFIMAKHAFQEGSVEAYTPFLDSELLMRSTLESARHKMEHYLQLQSKLHFLIDRQNWIDLQKKQVEFILFPLLRPFHWEDSAPGNAQANQYLPWYEVTRVNRKDLSAALLFGIRISFVVGMTSVFLALMIGSLLGMLAGYFAGKTDLLICRWIEVWEAMPTFFMLLLIVAITQSKSIFLVVTVLGLFGWTGFARFMRAEVLKQRNLSYTMAAKALGFGHINIMRLEILPNAIAPLLTLLPFSMMAAITSEAGLSFLGLGEEGSSSLGVLMDEGRHVFPGESYLLWPAAILLTILLIAIALVGDALRDAIDPKSQ